MTDVMSPEARSRLMSRIRGKDTGPERRLRSVLHARGLRFRKHVRELPGTPDIVFTRARVVVFVDGDFWHGWRFPLWEHKLSPFWAEKIRRNRQRDRRNFAKLRRMGWKVIRVWEHQIEKDVDSVADRIQRIVVARTSGSPGTRRSHQEGVLHGGKGSRRA